MPGCPARQTSAELPPIKGFLETSFLDWQGAISAVVFLPGCNFSCPYCHNHAVAAEPDSLMTFPLEDVLARLRPFVGWIDGVVVSGGEPTLHAGLPELLAEFKRAGFGVKLDTNGYRPEALAGLLARGLVDRVAMDVKAPLNEPAYARAAGRPVDVGRVRASLELLRSGDAPYELRTTLWPAWHGERELGDMARELAGARAWTLQAVDPAAAWNPEALGAGRPYTARELARLQAEVAEPACAAGR
jgi:pyruvate formate lyase activating enzyme